jgi:hypothetical protein
MINRRDFLLAGGSCAAQLGLFAMLPPVLRSTVRRRPIAPLVVEPWARIEQLGDSVWACVSTPLAGGQDVHRTFSNGGIVAGRSGVLVVEGFASDAGAQWISEMARERTGRLPTHVVLTHYHGDHSAGLGGYGTSTQARPTFVTTEATRGRLASARPAIAELLASAELVEAATPRIIDLGSISSRTRRGARMRPEKHRPRQRWVASRSTRGHAS